MKIKLLTGILALSALMAVVPAAEAAAPDHKTKTVSVKHDPQVWRGRHRGIRTVTRTRIVRVGFRRYRETYRITYLPNGRTITKVISRVRI